MPPSRSPRLLPLLALCPALAPSAQDEVGETVVVAPRSHETVTRSDALATTITQAELEATGERSLPRAIEKAAGGGVWLQETNLAGGSPVIRGLVGNHVLIVIDGVRLNDSATRGGPNQSLNNFDVASIDRVEVIRGPSSVLWGSDAIGGVILIWTKRAGTTGPDGESLDTDVGVGFQADSSLDGGSAFVDGAVRGRRWGLYSALTAWDFDDLETGDGTADETGYYGRSYFASFEHVLGENRSLRFTASGHKDLDVPRTDRVTIGYGQTEPQDAKFDYEVQDRRRFLLAYLDESDHAFSERAQVRLSYRTYTERRERQSLGSNTYRYERDEVETFGLGVDFQKALGDDHLLTYGLDLEHDDIDSTRDNLDLMTMVVTPGDGAFAPNAEYVRSGVFVQDETSFGGFDATLGARYSYDEYSFDPFDGGPKEEGDFDALTLSGQIARQVTDTVRVTGTVAQGYRAPNLEDLANEGEFAGGTELGNPDLDPEEALSTDLAVDWADGGWSAGGSVFFTRIDDVLGRELLDEGDPLVTGDETYLRVNAGRLELYGAEASLRHPIASDDGSSGLFASYSATLTKGRQFDDELDPTDGKTDARRIPPLFGRAALEYRPAQPLLGAVGLGWIDLELRWADRQEDLNPGDKSDPRINPDGTPGWGVVNLDLGGRATDALSWNAGVHNVFDKEYRVHASGFDAPGLAFVVGMEFRP